MQHDYLLGPLLLLMLTNCIQYSDVFGTYTKKENETLRSWKMEFSSPFQTIIFSIKVNDWKFTITWLMITDLWIFRQINTVVSI